MARPKPTLETFMHHLDDVEAYDPRDVFECAHRLYVLSWWMFATASTLFWLRAVEAEPSLDDVIDESENVVSLDDYRD